MITVEECGGRVQFRCEHGGGVTETVVMGEDDSRRLRMILARKAEPPPTPWIESFWLSLSLVPDHLGERRVVVRHTLH